MWHIGMDLNICGVAHATLAGKDLARLCGDAHVQRVSSCILGIMNWQRLAVALRNTGLIGFNYGLDGRGGEGLWCFWDM